MQPSPSRHGLPKDVVRHVAGRKDARNVGGGRSWLGLQITAHLHIELPDESSVEGLWPMATNTPSVRSSETWPDTTFFSFT